MSLATCSAARTGRRSPLAGVRERRAAARRRSAVSAAVCGEQLENRLAFAVAPPAVAVPARPPAAPSVWMTAATDTGARDAITCLTNPAFAGKSAPGTLVRVEAGGKLIGVTAASRSGDWMLATPAARAFETGPQTIQVTAVASGNVASRPTPYGFRIDNVSPTATLTYDNLTGRAVLRFSRPVTGVSPASLQLAGRTAAGASFAMSLTDPRLAAYAGTVNMIASADRTTYTFSTRTLLSEPGSYQLTTLTSPKIVDSMVGNAFRTTVSVRFSM